MPLSFTEMIRRLKDENQENEERREDAKEQKEENPSKVRKEES